MANNKSALKRIKKSFKKKLYNKYYLKTLRHSIKKILKSDDKTQIKTLYTNTISMIDKLKSKNILHKNNASNKKSRISLHYNKILLN
ncbi:MAG: 30S ribosomal protein S20 [Bacteroides sp.]|nr:MAG: 30S ribosomal protein S20 [Bacteroides sp.]